MFLVHHFQGACGESRATDRDVKDSIVERFSYIDVEADRRKHKPVVKSEVSIICVTVKYSY